MSKTKKGTGSVTGGKTSHKTWLEGPPWKNADKMTENLRGSVTTKYVKAKTYPANYIKNEHTGRMERPK